MERREHLSAGGLGLLLRMELGAGLALALLAMPSSCALPAAGCEQSGWCRAWHVQAAVCGDRQKKEDL